MYVYLMCLLSSWQTGHSSSSSASSSSFLPSLLPSFLPSFSSRNVLNVFEIDDPFLSCYAVVLIIKDCPGCGPIDSMTNTGSNKSSSMQTVLCSRLRQCHLL